MARDARRGNADERLAANLRTLRERAGMSQSALAAAMVEKGWPWHQSTVYRVESGKQTVSFGEASDLAEILRTSLDRFTWLLPEASETELVYAAGTNVRHSHEIVAGAVVRLLADRAAAERRVAESKDSKWPRVHEALEDTAATLVACTLEDAVEEGGRRYEKRAQVTGEDGEVREPDLVAAPDKENRTVTFRLHAFDQDQASGISAAVREGSVTVLDMEETPPGDVTRWKDYAGGTVNAYGGYMENIGPAEDRKLRLVRPAVTQTINLAHVGEQERARGSA